MPNEEKNYVTISEERYSELLRAECVFKLLEHVISEKAKRYGSISYDEVQIYNVLFLNSESEDEEE